ncbi:undecaprenyl-phosphate 4-deoxy-4-formamido-L-arabinose transferase [bacterium BMS3Abin05]|nr:undecaprenyl-phosphate 4-deoxy-4-formamido-L-arabinose transferase [bacterium BMS3Abin05]GBE27473.1 undecaprenyl-phosphate 4-deoxy-4-formamido-L-arabinose transferase [bacterium BMS3Bbin03]
MNTSQDMKLELSVVIPLYNEKESLPELYRQLTDALEKAQLTYELIFVDDGSRDGSSEVLEELAQKDSRLRVIQFQKNYGKSAALSVAFEAAEGEVVATLDADLQDDPYEIPQLIRKLEEGYDLVSGWKKKRRDPLSKKLPSKIFNRVTSLLSGVHIHDINCGLKVYRRFVVKTLHPYGELHRFLPVLAHLNGFTVGEKEVVHHPRKHGRSKFGASRFTAGFFDLMTVMFLSKYLKKPLHLFGILGVLSFIGGLGILIYLTILRLSGHWIGNRPILFLGILLMILGVQFVSIGLLGEMVTASQNSSEEYVVRRRINF